MKYIKQQKGQIGIGQLLVITSSIIVAIIGGWFGQGSRTDAKLELTKEEQKANNLALVQRVAVSETKVDNLQKDVQEIKSDVKQLLKLLK